MPVSAFATPEFTTSLASISRIDGQRVVTVSADLAAGYNGNALLAQVQDLLSDLGLPPGYRSTTPVRARTRKKAKQFLTDAFAIAMMLILLVLISQFASIWQPLIIIFSVLLSLIGVLGGLLVTGTAFGIIMTGVGVISLAGIVVNNAIVLLDYINQLRERGMDKTEAIVQAGMTRFRPVVLTAITTILGLIPLTTGFSLDFGKLFAGDADRRRVEPVVGSMGVAVIWGLAVATFLTLIVVPVMYASLEGIKLAFAGPPAQAEGTWLTAPTWSLRFLENGAGPGRYMPGRPCRCRVTERRRYFTSVAGWVYCRSRRAQPVENVRSPRAPKAASASLPPFLCRRCRPRRTSVVPPGQSAIVERSARGGRGRRGPPVPPRPRGAASKENVVTG